MTQAQQLVGQVDFNALIASSSASNRAVTEAAGLPTADIATAVAAANAEKLAKAQANLAATVVVVRSAGSNIIAASAAEIAKLEKAIEAQRAVIGNVKQTQLYTDVTGNGIPELIASGYGSLVPNTVPESERKIPKDWTPTVIPADANQQ